MKKILIAVVLGGIGLTGQASGSFTQHTSRINFPGSRLSEFRDTTINPVNNGGTRTDTLPGRTNLPATGTGTGTLPGNGTGTSSQPAPGSGSTTVPNTGSGTGTGTGTGSGAGTGTLPSTGSGK